MAITCKIWSPTGRKLVVGLVWLGYIMQPLCESDHCIIATSQIHMSHTAQYMVSGHWFSGKLYSQYVVKWCIMYYTIIFYFYSILNLLRGYTFYFYDMLHQLLLLTNHILYIFFNHFSWINNYHLTTYNN